MGQWEVERGPERWTECVAAPEVIKAFYAYHDGLLRMLVRSQQTDLDSNYVRLSEKALRIAMLMASLEGDNRIEMRHWAKAQEIAERWRAGLHHVVGTLAEPKLCSGERDEDRVLHHLEHILGGLVRSGAVGGMPTTCWWRASWMGSCTRRWPGRKAGRAIMSSDSTEQPALVPLCAVFGAQLLQRGRLRVHACPDGRVVLFLETGKKGGACLELMPADVTWLARNLKVVQYEE